MAVTINNTTSNRNSTGDITTSVTVNSGSNRFMLVFHSVQDSNHANYPVRSMTYNGVHLSKLIHYEPSGNVRIEVWYLVAPDVGTANLVVDTTGSLGESADGVVIFNGVDQFHPIDQYTGGSGSGFAPTMSVTTTRGNGFLAAGIVAEADITAVGDGQTSQWDLSDQSYENSRGSTKACASSAGSESSAFGMASGQPYAQALVAVRAANADQTEVRDYASVDSPGDSNVVGATTYAKRADLKFTPAANSDYYLFGYLEMQSGTISQYVKTRLYNNTDTVTYSEAQCLLGDVRDWSYFTHCGKYSSGASPSEVEMSIDVGGEGATQRTSSRNVRLFALKKGTSDADNSSTGESTTTSSTYQNKVTLTFTPASQGDYLILAFAMIGSASTSSSSSILVKCTVDSTDYQACDITSNDATDYYQSYSWARKVNLTAAEHNIYLKYASQDNSTTVKIKQAYVIAIRLSDFTSYSDNDDGATSTSNSAVQTKSTITDTVQAFRHITFFSALNDADSALRSDVYVLKDDIATHSQNIREPVSSADFIPYLTFKAADYSIDTTPNIVGGYNDFDGAGTTYIQESSLITLQLDTTAGAETKTTTFTIDGIVLSRGTKTFTIDGIVKATLTKTFTIDAIVKETKTKTFTIDAIVKATQTKTFTIDCIVKATQSTSFTIDAVVKETKTKTFTIDGLVKATQSTSFTIDGIVKATQTKTFTIDGVVKATQTTTFTIDAIVKEQKTTTFTIDGLVKATQTATFTIDGVVKATQTKTFTIDGIVKATQTTTFTIDALIREQKTVTFTIDGLVKATQTKTFTIDGIVKATQSTSFTIDAIVKETKTKTFTIDGLVRATQTATFTIDGIVKATQTKTFTIDAVVKQTQTTSFTIDGLVREQKTKTFTIDGIVKATQSATFTIDGIVKATQTASFTIDGLVQEQTITTFTIDGIVKATQSKTFTIDAVVKETQTTTFTIDAMVSGRGSVTFTIDGYIIARNTKTFTIDGLVMKQYFEEFSDDFNRANQALANDDWEVKVGDYQIISNQLSNQETPYAGYVRNTHLPSKPDQYVRFNAYNSIFDGGPSLMLRTNDVAVASRTGYQVSFRERYRDVNIFRIVNGSPTLLLDSSPDSSWADGDTLIADVETIDANTVRIQCFANNVLIASVDDTNASRITSNGYIFIYGGDEIDNFSLGVIAPHLGTETFTIDGIVVSRQTKTFTIDGIVVAIQSVNFTIDAVVKEEKTELFTIDAIVKATQTKTFTIDGIVKATQSINFTIDAVVKEQQTALFTIDGIVKATNTETFTIDAIVVVTQTKTFTIDGLILNRETKTFTIDGLVKATNTTTFTIDAIISLLGEAWRGDTLDSQGFADEEDNVTLYDPLADIFWP